jgi:hypothetical protein
MARPEPPERRELHRQTLGRYSVLAVHIERHVIT